MTAGDRVSEVVPAALSGERVDRLVSMLTGVARAEAAGLIAAGAVRIGGLPVATRSRRVAEGERIEVDVPPGADRTPRADPTVAVTVAYEDPWLVVVDKAAGVVVHPGAGNPGGTLVNGLLARYPDLAGVGDPDRPGIVHRLDKGTSGLMVVARTADAHRALVALIASRAVQRIYLALVAGTMEASGGTVDAPVGRSARQPTRMTVSASGREARTRYRVVRRFTEPAPATLVECSLETGRTHQIRVHLAAIGHPVVGDDRYGGRGGIACPRPFLHSQRLVLSHPVTGATVDVSAPLPADLADVLAGLR